MILDSSSVLWMYEIEDVIADEGDGIVTVFADRFADEDDVALSIEPIDDVWQMTDDVATDLFERSQHPLNTKLGLWVCQRSQGRPCNVRRKGPDRIRRKIRRHGWLSPCPSGKRYRASRYSLAARVGNRTKIQKPAKSKTKSIRPYSGTLPRETAQFASSSSMSTSCIPSWKFPCSSW